MIKSEIEKDRRVKIYRELLSYFIKLREERPRVRFISALCISKDLSKDFVSKNQYTSEKVNGYLEHLAAAGLVVQSPFTFEYAFNEFKYRDLSRRQLDRLLKNPPTVASLKGFNQWQKYVSQLRSSSC